jgi:hypothetical protein
MFRTEYKSEFAPFRYRKEYNVLDLLRNTKTIIQDSKVYNGYMTNYTRKLNDARKLNEHLTLPKAYQTISTFSDCYSPTLTIPDQLKTESNFYPTPRERTKLSFHTFKFNTTRNSNPISVFYTQSDIFCDLSYIGLTYDFDKMYKKDDYYINMLRDKVEEFRGTRNENLTTNLERRYTGEGTGTNPMLDKVITMYSLEIKFNNISIDSAESPKELCIYLPFALLPIYYYVDIETFKLLLMSVLRFNDEFTEVTMDESSLYSILNSWNEYKTDATITLSHSNIQKFYWLTSKCIFEVFIKYWNFNHLEYPGLS